MLFATHDTIVIALLKELLPQQLPNLKHRRHPVRGSGCEAKVFRGRLSWSTDRGWSASSMRSGWVIVTESAKKTVCPSPTT